MLLEEMLFVGMFMFEQGRGEGGGGKFWQRCSRRDCKL